MSSPILILVLFALGFIFLIKGADFLVEGASSLAKRLKISDIVIGLTIVAFGTSAPELVVNLIASLQGNTDIAIGNILGSNIANIFLILGISAIISPLIIKRNTTWKEIPLSLLAAVLVGVMANDVFFDNSLSSALTRTDGIALLSFFIIFLYYTYGISKVNLEKEEAEKVKKLSVPFSILMIIIGLIGLTLGGKWVVDGAISIASAMGLSESLIGLTVVAIGTSLPELATSIVAAYKKKTDIAVGNIVGSNIFNAFWILGVSATINPLPFKTSSNIDILVAIFASFLLFLWMFIGRKHELEKWQGIIFVLLYVGYIGFLVYQG